jgi:tetratricopeptide (TPR) repeat protein
LGQLNQILDAARSRSDCHLATVIGSAGIGKSRLADEFLQESRGGAETVVGHCLPHGEGTPLWPITDIVKQLAGDVTSEAIAQLLSADPLADEIAARLSPLVNPIAEADLDDVAWAAKKFIESVAAQRALVAVLDDVQWASEPLLNVIDYLTDWSSGVPLLLVCLARPELLDRRPTWGGGKPNATAISLDALSQSEASVLLSRVPGSAALGEAERAHILEVGDGNPLFLEEMVALARDQPGLPLKVPPTITAILAARLTRLSGPEQHVLTRAAIVGRDPTLNALNSIVDRRVVRDVVPVLRRLVRKDFLRPQRSMIRGDEAFRFRHVLIRDVAYESAPVPSRAAVHEKVGQWLAGRAAEVGDDIQPVVGHHLERAHALGRYEDAPHKRRRLALRAAAALSSQREYEVGPAGIRERIDCLQRAAALLAEHGMPRARILADIGVDLEQQSQWVAAATRYAEAQALGQEAGDQDLVTYVGLLLEILAGRAATSFTLNDALTAAEAAFTELSTSRNPLYADRVRATLASMHLSGGKAAECEELLAPLVAERKGSWTRVQHMSLRVLMAAWVWGPRSVAFAVSRCEAVLAERTPLRVEASASRYLAVLRAMEGRFDEARTYIERDQAILNELGLRAAAAGMQVFRGVIELLAENPSEAENVLRPALEILQGLREQWYSGGVAAVLAQALCAQQKLGESWEMTILSAELNSRDVAVPIWNAATRAKVLSANGDPRAVVEAEHAVRLARATDHINEEAGSLFTLGFVASTLGDDLASASAALSRASALYAAKGNTVMLNQTHNLLRSLESIL